MCGACRGDGTTAFPTVMKWVTADFVKPGHACGTFGLARPRGVTVAFSVGSMRLSKAMVPFLLPMVAVRAKVRLLAFHVGKFDIPN